MKVGPIAVPDPLKSRTKRFPFSPAVFSINIFISLFVIGQNYTDRIFFIQLVLNMLNQFTFVLCPEYSANFVRRWL